MLIPQLVVFDLAGTTVHDGGQVPAAFIAALADHGVEVSADTIRGLRGASKRHAILELLPEAPDRAQRAERVYSDFRGHLAARYAEGVRAVSGASDVFSSLRAHGVQVALNTGFDREIVASLLDALGWDARVVDAVVAADDVAEGRPAPDLLFAAMARCGVVDPAAVAAVGDTRLDLEAGHRAGVGWNVGVLSGAHDRATLEAAPHTHLLNSVADLPALWWSQG